MKKLFAKVQSLSEKAAQLHQAVQSLPTKAAEARQAITMSAGELQQLRSEVQTNLSWLQANSEDRLLDAMRKINDAAPVFEEAGYDLSGMDLDLSLTHRLAVHLDKVEDVSDSHLRAILGKERRDIIRSILAGLIKAEETAANVELSHLTYCGVVVHIGSAPLIRMCWRDEAALEASVLTPATPAVATPPPLPTATATPMPTTFGSMFEQRPAGAPTTSPTPATTTPASAKETSPLPAPSISVSTQPTPVAPEKPAANPWSRSALDRFKKMPDLSKHR